MQNFEILIAVLALVLTILLLWIPNRRLCLRIVGYFLALSITAQAILEGSHWQIWPLDLGSLLLIGAALISLRFPRRFVVVTVAVFAVLLLGLTVVLSWVFPMFHLPHPTGPDAVGTRLFHLVDTDRIEDAGPSPSGKRELMIQVWYPAEGPSGIAGSWYGGHHAGYQRRQELTFRASYRSVLTTPAFQDAPLKPAGPYPIVLYNPAWQGERTEGTFQAEELASHGFVVVAIDHTFFGGLVEFPDGRVADSHNAPELGSFEHSTLAEQAALGAKYAELEALDDIFVLNQLQARNEDFSSLFFHRLDLTRVGTLGYSVGGAVAEQAAFNDSRILSVVNLDGWSFGELQRRGLPKPLMVIYEDKANTLPTAEQLHSGPMTQQLYWQFSADDYSHVTCSLQQYGGWLLFVAGTNHVDFSDRSLFSHVRRFTGGGTLSPARTHAIVNAYTLAFFEQTLQGRNMPLLEENGSLYPEVEFHGYPGILPASKQQAIKP
jgi:predicted dienelactone hydrolase